MNEQRSFIRKVGYVCAIAVLLLPLSFLSMPATTESPGGQLARFRSAHELSQTNLGEIDPAGETMKLATLGLRGVAANLLWDRANEFKKKEDWTSLSATLEQITKLQPNYVSVWQFQGWNIAYNVGVEFDDYHDRYQWIIKGINFLKRGVRYNAREPRLLWDIGWNISNKIGRADEKVLYRQMFREDDEFHNEDDPTRGRSQRDNWLVGAAWFERAEKLLDLGVPFKGSSPTGEGKSPILFYSNRPMCEINYADALEDDGTFGEVAKVAWNKAAKSWNEYGNRDLPTTHNMIVRLNDQERMTQRVHELSDELSKLTSGVREKIRDERLEKLTPEERKIVETPKAERSLDNAGTGFSLDNKIVPTAFEVAEAAPENVRLQALKLANAIQDAQQVVFVIDQNRDPVNFVYWRGRCELERDDTTIAARKAIYQAEQTFKAADLVEAGKLYDEGFQLWRKALDKFPVMAADATTIDELYDVIDRYGYYLSKVEKKITNDFILADVVVKGQTINFRGEPKKWVPQLERPEPAKPAAESAKPTEEPAKPAAEPGKDQPPAKDADKPAADAKPATDTKPAAQQTPASDAKPAAENSPKDAPATDAPAKAEKPASP